MRSIASRLAPVVGLLLLLVPGVAVGQDAPTTQTLADDLSSVITAVDSLWVVVAACLVLFMQAGFALL